MSLCREISSDFWWRDIMERDSDISGWMVRVRAIYGIRFVNVRISVKRVIARMFFIRLLITRIVTIFITILQMSIASLIKLPPVLNNFTIATIKIVSSSKFFHANVFLMYLSWEYLQLMVQATLKHQDVWYCLRAFCHTSEIQSEIQGW